MKVGRMKTCQFCIKGFESELKNRPVELATYMKEYLKVKARLPGLYVKVNFAVAQWITKVGTPESIVENYWSPCNETVFEKELTGVQ